MKAYLFDLDGTLAASEALKARALARAGVDLQNSFDLVITREDVTRRKPDPEAYLLALSRLRLSAKDTIVFEDSSAGLKAATAAGCRCIAVRHAFNSKHDFSGAFREIESFSEVLGAAAQD